MAEKPAARAEPRAFWSGTITFGLVSVPVDLYAAVRSRRVPLRMMGSEGRPLQRRYYCSADGEPLTGDEIVRGYEWEDGEYTVVENPDSWRAIALVMPLIPAPRIAARCGGIAGRYCGDA